MATQLAHQGKGEDAIEQVRRAVAEEPDDGRLHYNAACFYARLGRPEEAIRELKEGTKNLTGYLFDWPRRDPDLASLRDHPEFIALLGRAQGPES